MRVYVKIAALMMALLCVFSCKKHEAELEINTLVVSGTVYAMDTGEPLSNVTVSLMGFGDDDEHMAMKPLDTKLSYTDLEGNYKITLFGPKAQKYFKVVATDESYSRENDNYQSSLILLYISDGTAYNRRTKTYELFNMDFSLKK